MSDIGYKGFDKDLKCRGFQYEIGKEYHHPGLVKCCPNDDDLKAGKGGLHYCKNPLDVLRYYRPSDSRFTTVDPSGVQDEHEEDSKVATEHIKINAEIGLKGLIEAGMKFTFSKIKWGKEDTPQTHGDSSAAQTHGYYSAAQTHGDSSAAQTHGDSSAAQTHGYSSAAQTHGYSSAAQTHGYYSAAQTHGDESIAVSTGIQGKASGILGNWLVLAEWEDKDGQWAIKSVKTVKVDGDKIKPDTLYMLKDGEFVETN